MVLQNKFHISSPVFKALKRACQSIEPRNLPMATLELFVVSRLMMTFPLLVLGSLILGDTSIELWSDRPKGGCALDLL